MQRRRLLAGAAVEAKQPPGQAIGVTGAVPGTVGAPSLVAQPLELGVPAAPGVPQAAVVGRRGDGGQQGEAGGQCDEEDAELHGKSYTQLRAPLHRLATP